MNEFDPANESNPASPAGSPSLGERISDVIVAPVRAMTATAERPMWWAPALLVFVIMFLYTALNAHHLMPAQTEMQLENAPAGQVEMLEEQLELFRDPPIWLRVLSGLGAGFGVTILGGLIFALITHMFLKLSEGGGRLGQSVGVVFWAGLIAHGLKPIVSWIILVTTGSVTAAGLTAASLFADPDPGSTAYVLASVLGDPFAWWMIGVVAIGMAIAHRMTFGRAATVVVATYLLLSAILVVFALVGQAVSGA
jgi:hypothetical protein